MTRLRTVIDGAGTSVVGNMLSRCIKVHCLKRGTRMIVKVELTGTSPLLLHNNQTADPLNDFAREIKAITSKRKKTDADHLEIRRLEFKAGLYMDEYGPIIPNQNIRKMLIEGARKDKNGKQFESGVFVLGHAKIEYDGPRDAEDMWKAGFGWSTLAGNQRSTIVRTRPRFDVWSATFNVELDEALVSLDLFELALSRAERSVGIGDGRSIGFGRFMAASAVIDPVAVLGSAGQG